MKLDRLYKSTKTGAIQICDISVLCDVYNVEFGQLDGKLQLKSTACKGKNIGKANETSPEQQAVIEAKAKWTKKVKAGYSTDNEAPVTVQLPRRVKEYIGNENKISYPGFSTLKLNGINGTYWLMPDNSLLLTSRGGNVYPPIPHLEERVRADMAAANTTCQNGELYIHGAHLQDIKSAVSKTKALSAELTFRVFELPLIDKPYKDRVKILRTLPMHIEITEVNSREEVDSCYEKAMAKKFEGTVVYNADGMHKFNERSSDVYKYKKTIDAEFEIVGYNLDKNGHSVYECLAENGEMFNVKRKGTNEERLADAELAYFNIGRWLNVEYEILSKAGKPLKPVGNDFRICDEDGQPLE